MLAPGTPVLPGMPVSTYPPKAEPASPRLSSTSLPRALVPLLRKRFEEGERKLHPFARPGVTERRATHPIDLWLHAASAARNHHYRRHHRPRSCRESN